MFNLQGLSGRARAAGCPYAGSRNLIQTCIPWQGMVLLLSQCQPQQGRGCRLFSAGPQISSIIPPCSKQSFPLTRAPSLSSTETEVPPRRGLWLKLSGSQPAVGTAGGAEAELNWAGEWQKKIYWFAVPRYSPESERSCTRN